jgi:hypothetical protein
MVRYEISELIKKTKSKSRFKCINKGDSREKYNMRDEEERYLPSPLLLVRASLKLR